MDDDDDDADADADDDDDDDDDADDDDNHSGFHGTRFQGLELRKAVKNFGCGV